MTPGQTLDKMTKDERKAHPMARGLIDYFPDALAAVANVSHVGNEQHNPGQPLHWDRTKSTDQADCLMRHFAARGTFDDDGLRHSAKIAWRALALLQVELEVADQSTMPEFSPDTEAFLQGWPSVTTPTYYIAGPMRGYPDMNFPAFDDASRIGKMMGFNIISPADLDRAVGLPMTGEDLTRDQLDSCISRDISAILGLDPKTDGIAVLPRWEGSRGACTEVALARWRGLEVVCAEDFTEVLYERDA